MLANGTHDRGMTQRTNGQDVAAAPSALYREAEVRRGSATETSWSTLSLTAMTSGENGSCGSSMRGEKPHRRGEEGPGGRLGKPCCGKGRNGQTGRRAETFACTASNQPRGPLACGGGAEDTFSRAGSGVGGDGVIGRTRWWTLESRGPS